MSWSLILASWGAFVSTSLAILQVIKFFKERPRLRVSASLSFATCGEDKEDTYGVKVMVKRGSDLLCEEALVSFTVRNFGLQSLQISSIYVETFKSITQIIPENLPVILQPNTSITVNIQPEWLSERGNKKSLPLQSAGVLDALGKKHSLDRKELGELQSACEELPLRIGTFRHNETGDLVTAFAMKDPAVFINKK